MCEKLFPPPKEAYWTKLSVVSNSSRYILFFLFTCSCNHWLRHFGVSYKLVDQLGGLQKLRICSRHFSQRQEMAKTRIKMTPLRKSSSSKGIVLPINAAGGSVIAGALAGGGGAGTGSGAVKSAVANSTTIELVEVSGSTKENKSSAFIGVGNWPKLNFSSDRNYVLDFITQFSLFINQLKYIV